MLNFGTLIKKYWFLLLQLLIVVIIVNALSLTFPYYTGQIINAIDKKQDYLNIIYILAAVTAGLFVMDSLQIIIGAFFREKIGFELRKALIENVATKTYQEINNLGVGDAITIFGSDVNIVKDTMAGEFVNSIKAILLFISAIIILFVNNWQVGLIAFVSLPVLIFAFGTIFKSVSKYFKAAQEVQTKLNNTISQNIYGANLVRIQNAQNTEISKFNVFVRESRDISLKIIDAFSSLIPIINTVSSWTIWAIIYYGGVLYVGNKIQLGDINAYLGYYGLLIAPIFIIGFNSQGIARIAVSLNRINKFIKKEVKESGSEKKHDLKKITNTITVSNLSYTVAEKVLLDNINLSIKIGQKTAILGPTGAGKSLLLNMLTGMLKAETGEIIYDEINIENINTADLKQLTASVFQESLVFAGSLKDNVVLDRAFVQSDFEKAIYTATLDNLLLNKEGNITELGTDLSGGQKQRLTLARALYGNPQVLFLDDFTARVDKTTEMEIYKRLSENYPNTTIVSIAQQIDSIKDYDSIHLLMEGELLASGTHPELLKTSHEYQQIFKSQQTYEQQ
jgi:ATP-binding cassette, subfamily B, bacterial